MREWSAILPMRPEADGRFVYPHAYRFVDDDHEPLLFDDGAKIVGFALARRVDDAWQVQEFFVLPAERRRRVGQAAFAALVSRRPGPWTLTVREENPAALAFWSRVFAEPPVTELGADGVSRRRFWLRA